MNEEDTKTWWMSRTIWTQIIGLIFIFGTQFDWFPKEVDQEGVVVSIMTIVAILTTLFRVKAKKMIQSEGGIDDAP